MEINRQIIYPGLFSGKPKRASFEGTYNRFVDYTKIWLFGIMTNDREITKLMPDGDNKTLDYDFGENYVSENQVWNLLTRAGKSDKMPKALSDVPQYDDNEGARGVVYDVLMPAYRAIRESFQSRPWYHWITDHANYTAERDAMHAIRGSIRALTGDTKEQVDAAYTEYHNLMTENAAENTEEVANKADLEATDKKIRFTVDELSPALDQTVSIQELHREAPNKDLDKSIGSI